MDLGLEGGLGGGNGNQQRLWVWKEKRFNFLENQIWCALVYMDGPAQRLGRVPVETRVCPVPVKCTHPHPHRWTMVQQQKSWKHTFMAVVQSTVLPYSVTNLVAILKGK